MIAFRAAGLVAALVVTMAGCGGGAPTAQPTTTPTSMAPSRDPSGLNGCREAAILARGKNIDRDDNYLTGASAGASTNPEIAEAGRAMVDLLIRTGEQTADHADDITRAQEAIVQACTQVLGNQPW